MNRFARSLQGGFGLMVSWVATATLLVFGDWVWPALHFRIWLGDGNVAAWVQAVGSLIGLGVAIWVPVRQRELDREHARALQRAQQYQDLVKLMWTAELITQFITGQYVQAIKPPAERATSRFDDHGYTDLLERLRLLYMLDFGGEYFWRMVGITFRNALVSATDYLRAEDGSLRLLQPADSPAQGAVRSVSMQMGFIQKAIVSLEPELRERGVLPPPARPPW